jgi:hypothetical protein
MAHFRCKIFTYTLTLLESLATGQIPFDVSRWHVPPWDSFARIVPVYQRRNYCVLLGISSTSNWKGHRTVDALLLFHLVFFINHIPFRCYFVWFYSSLPKYSLFPAEMWKLALSYRLILFLYQTNNYRNIEMYFILLSLKYNVGIIMIILLLK